MHNEFGTFNTKNFFDHICFKLMKLKKLFLLKENHSAASSIFACIRPKKGVSLYLSFSGPMMSHGIPYEKAMLSIEKKKNNITFSKIFTIS